MIRRYGLVGFLLLTISWLYTKVFFRKARLIRLPLDIRNRSHIEIGIGLTTGKGCRLEVYPSTDARNNLLVFGENVEINDYVHIAAGEKINIGDNVLIASKVFITDLNHGSYDKVNQDSPDSIPKTRKLTTKPVIIKNNVWIGEGVCIMPGVTIGFGSVVGALSVVTKDIPDYSMAVGSPARVIKVYDFKVERWVNVR